MGARVFQGQIRPDTRFDKLATSESDGSGSSKPPASASIMRTAGQALRGRAVALSDCQRLYTSTPKYLISKPDLCITVADNVQRQAHSEVLNGVSSTAKPLLSLRQLREQALDLPNVEGMCPICRLVSQRRLPSLTRKMCSYTRLLNSKLYTACLPACA